MSRQFEKDDMEPLPHELNQGNIIIHFRDGGWQHDEQGTSPRFHDMQLGEWKINQPLRAGLRFGHG